MVAARNRSLAAGGRRAAAQDGNDAGGHVITFSRLKHVSFFHSLVYIALLIVAFGFNNPQPETFILGLSHGLLWIGMSLVCLAAVRLRIVPLRVAVAVAVLGGIGPFFGSAEFIREERRRARVEA
jgi:type IV secretory pathway VirB6-like protein